jgi:enoyl-CoA hydratase
VPDYQFVTYEKLGDGRVVRILLNRPETRNAQNRGLLVELDDAFRQAEKDDDIRVVILGGVGPMFSSGHDLGSAQQRAEREPGPMQHETMLMDGGTRLGAEQRMLQEWRYFYQNTLRWRNLRKITIAQVNGAVYAAGLMLMWACDLIVASKNAVFADPVGVRLGMCGMEYFAHPWEFGPRRAKELLLTGDSMSAEEAHQVGMVSKLFDDEDLSDRTLEFAERIAGRPTAAALLIKESVNQSVDCMGFYNALQACFSLHQLNHAHWAEVNENGQALGSPEHGVPSWKDAPPIRPAVRDSA